MHLEKNSENKNRPLEPMYLSLVVIYLVLLAGGAFVAGPALRGTLLQCVAVWCSVVQCGAVRGSAGQCGAVRCSAVQCGAVWCSVLRCVASCCSLIQCVSEW